MTDYPELKKELFRKCSEHVNERISTIQTAMDSVYQSKLSETKSSAGDKFETGRVHMQMEEEKLKTQMHRAKIDSEFLTKIANRSVNDQVGSGNLIQTSSGTYFMSIGIGKVNVQGKDYYCISAQSPIGTELYGKVQGDNIHFNGREIKIMEIY